MSSAKPGLRMLVDIGNIVGPDIEEMVQDAMSDMGVTAKLDTQLQFAHDVPTWVHFVVDHAGLAALIGPAAGIYLKKWIELYAQEHFNHRKELYAAVRKGMGVAIGALGRFAKLVADLHKAVPGTSVWIRFNDVPISVALHDADEDEVVAILARITYNMPVMLDTASVLMGQLQNVRRVVVKVELDSPGFILTWHDRQRACYIAQRFSEHGQLQGQPYRVEDIH